MRTELTAPAPENTEHNRKITGLFASIAGNYDFLNHALSLGFDFYWRRVLVASLAAAPEGIFLDLAAGTFDVSLALAKAFPGRLIIGADLCLPMLGRGLPKIEPCAAITPLNADACHLPFADNSLAAVAVSFGLRNMPRLPALEEMRRVLRPGGRLAVLEFGSSRQPVWFGLYNFYLHHVLPRLGGFFSGDRAAYAYLAESVREFPPAAELDAEMRAAGFGAVHQTRLSGGIVYLHSAEKMA